MRVLLTNNSLADRAGSELYLRDVAAELMRRGHKPVAYSTVLGQVAKELKSATIPVIESLDSLGEAPDIIHGQHHYETLCAMLRFPRTPTISYCHGWLPWQEAPLRFPRILRYVAVDEVCRERLITEGGVAASEIEVVLNFFDERLFPRRAALPEKPRLALVFSNTFGEDTGVQTLHEACRECGIELHAAGSQVGRSEAAPGELLQKYDLVFAKARGAIEAMAVGAAVILCNPGRMGALVTTENFARLRPLNFGIRALDQPLEVKQLVKEISKYDARDAEQVCATVRNTCEMQGAIDQLIALYERVIEENKALPVDVSANGDRAVARYLEQNSFRYKGVELEPDRDRWLKRCLAAEAARDYYAQHLAESEQALRKLETLNAESFAQHEKLATDWTARYDDSVREANELRHEIDTMRSWPAWRFAERVFESYPMRFLMRPAARAMRKQWRAWVTG